MQEIRRGESSYMGVSCARFNLPASRCPVSSNEYFKCFGKTCCFTLNIKCVLVMLTHSADKEVEVNIAWKRQMQKHVCTKCPRRVQVIGFQFLWIDNEDKIY